MTYRVKLDHAAARQLRKLDPPAQRRIQAAIELLAEDPRPAGAKNLVGGDGEWRVRTGDYRVIYEIHDQLLIVLVIAIGHRRRSIGRASLAGGDPETTVSTPGDIL